MPTVKAICREAYGLPEVLELRYGLGETAEAFDQLGQGHAQGKLVVAIG